MDLSFITDYLLQYGYVIIILCLFCGIVGIPAPEETFMVLVGILAANHHLDLPLSFAASFTGIFLGMTAAYVIGRRIGPAFIEKYGRYVFITPEKWENVASQFHRYGRYTLVFAYFFPGIRQVSPYIAGTAKYPLLPYFLLSTLGNLIWTAVFVVGGYYVGNSIPLHFLAWIPVFYVAIFAVIWLNKKRKKR